MRRIILYLALKYKGNYQKMNEAIKRKEQVDLNGYIDVLVDGQYKDELHNPKLKWCGSSNQRVIDVKESLDKKKIILYETNELVGV